MILAVFQDEWLSALNVGLVVSTVTVFVVLVATLLLFQLSDTCHAFNLNVVVHCAFAVYVNVYDFPFVTFATAAALKSTTVLV